MQKENRDSRNRSQRLRGSVSFQATHIYRNWRWLKLACHRHLKSFESHWGHGEGLFERFYFCTTLSILPLKLLSRVSMRVGTIVPRRAPLDLQPLSFLDIYICCIGLHQTLWLTTRAREPCTIIDQLAEHKCMGKRDELPLIISS